MKKIWVCLYLCLVVLAVTACGNQSASESLAGVPNPLVEYASVEEAEKAMGVECKTPSMVPTGYQEVSIASIDNSVLQILYTNTAGAEFVFRTGATEDNADDMIGVYSEFEVQEVLDIQGVSVAVQGHQNEEWNTGAWESEGMRYAFIADEPLSVDALNALISSIG